jgi:hypothetical protein
MDGQPKKIKDTEISLTTLKEIIYHYVVCGKGLISLERDYKDSLPKELFEEVPSLVHGERAIELIWKFANESIRNLLEKLCKRELYKRVYEISISELSGENDTYFILKDELSFLVRPKKAYEIEQNFLRTIYKAMVQKGPVVTITEDAARTRLKELETSNIPNIVIDFPTRGISKETNFPLEISDSSRKYLSEATSLRPNKQIFKTIRTLQIQSVVLRIYASPDLHELIIRYLEIAAVEACVKDVIHVVKQ